MHLIGLASDKRLGRHIQAADMMVKDAVGRYLQRSMRRWTRNTAATYGQVARSHIYPHIGRERLGALSTSRVQDWIDLLVRKGLSASVIGNARIILSGACADLVRMGELARNPVTGVRLPARKRKEKLTWTTQDVGKVYKAARMYPQMETYYRVAITTGMRPGEIRALKWSDVDFDAGVIMCQRTVTRDEQFRQMVGENTKTGRSRTIAVPAATLDSLRQLRQAQRLIRMETLHWKDTGLVFTRGDGNLLPQQTIATRHRMICAAAGVPRIRMHDTRHTAATLLLKAGVNPKIVSEILGHHSIAITLDVYSHVSVDMQRTATDLLGEIAE